MNKQTNTLEIIDGIYDIQPLAEPAFSFLETTLLSLLFLSLASLILYILWKNFYSKRAIAKREVKQLHKKYRKNKANSHDTIYQLCVIIKQGLKLKNLNNEVFLPKKLTAKSKQWEAFIEEISFLRYQNSEKKQIELEKLFSESLFWLKVWP